MWFERLELTVESANAHCLVVQRKEEGKWWKWTMFLCRGGKGGKRRWWQRRQQWADQSLLFRPKKPRTTVGAPEVLLVQLKHRTMVVVPVCRVRTGGLCYRLNVVDVILDSIEYFGASADTGHAVYELSPPPHWLTSVSFTRSSRELHNSPTRLSKISNSNLSPQLKINANLFLVWIT